ncbi:glycoside hydrolase 43 family protein [Paenibacillus sp. NFR01]|uniref:glycoside hydrolase family 43 protein n=1 Tax=Paenibacillus sp. NFR01 TaxID=1566279 RepID=UPI0008C23194|nr:glycoside hydrolase 43 family protein [Paenibacillus sp. NFR01]SEU20617.1 Beta-xylosidase [Paenibacillus sp. NFR01]
MGNTVIRNPVLWADVPDPSVIRVGDDYYMTSTSMHSMPGCPVMKSKNLMNWELIGYLYDSFEDHPAHRLADGKGIYGSGSWATSLRYHEGVFYACFSSNDMQQFYVYRTRDIEKGPWERSVLPGLHHDPSLLFDEGRVFVIHGNGYIRITELTPDARAHQPGGIDNLLFETESENIGLRCEGCHAYRLNGYYYLFFIEWPTDGNRRRRQVVYRSRELLGPYERRIVLDDDMGYGNNGVAQGGIVDTPAGEWAAVLFQDHGAVGRIPCVVPVRWEGDWPVFGEEGKVPVQFEIALPADEAKPLVISDGFDDAGNGPALNWQWNHVPDPEHWSLTERPGWLRLRTGHPAASVEYARNTLTQRTEGPRCSASVLLETGGMQPGGRAGLVALQHQFGTVGIWMDDAGNRRIVRGGNGELGREVAEESVSCDAEQICLKIAFDFTENADTAEFFYSLGGDNWIPIGKPLQMKYTLDHFMGYRIGLYHYATVQGGGYADFDDFRYTGSLSSGK